MLFEVHSITCHSQRMGRKVVKLRTGVRFGRLKVIGEGGRRPAGEVLWLCVCDCGTEKRIPGSRLRSGASKSCGCLRRERGHLRGRQNRTHGHASGGATSPTYRTWRAMIQRCTDLNATGYDNYGGRGIKVCDRWLEGFENFVVDMGLRPSGRTIDRLDPNGNYTRENCRWATDTQQRETRRDSISLEYKGEKRSLLGWSKHLGIPYATLHQRWSKGWPTEKILSKRNFRMKQELGQ